MAVGDRAFRRKCYERIDAELATGKTLFVVSHSEGNLKRFCERGLYLADGGLKLDGSIDDVIKAYQHDTGGVNVEDDAALGAQFADVGAGEDDAADL
jgi:ABC-2 type transport system ATP-binding protein